MDDFRDPTFVEGISDLDIRAQLEVLLLTDYVLCLDKRVSVSQIFRVSFRVFFSSHASGHWEGI